MNNRVVNNVVASNTQNSVVSWPPVGTGNVVQKNIFWANGTQGDMTGLTSVDNVTADPRFAGTSDYRLRSVSPF